RLKPFLGRRILEAGLGLGTFTARLSERADSFVGVDVDQGFVEAARRRFSGRPRLEFFQADLEAGPPAAFGGRGFDTAVCMNVLEHIRDDAATLKTLYSLLEPGGRLVLTVPQYPWLYGSLDRSLGHYRRYDRRALERLLREAGFRVEHQGSFNLAG